MRRRGPNVFTEFGESIRIAGEALAANKLRAGLTTLGIIIGIVTVSLMGSAIEGLNQAFLRSISFIGADVLYVQKRSWFSEEPWWKMRGRDDITYQQARELARQAEPLALATSIEMWTRRTVRHANVVASSVGINGVSEEAALAQGIAISDGRFFSPGEVLGARPVCVLGADVADRFFRYQSPIGQKVRIGDYSYEVVGVIEKRGKFFTGESLDYQVLMPITRALTDLQSRADLMIRIKVRDLAMLSESQEEIRGMMRRIRRVEPGQNDDFAINEQGAFVSTFNRVAGVIAGVGIFITGLSLFVGGIGIMNIMFVSVAERTREIGIRKAIGARKRTILIQFLMEAIAICLFGGLIGLAITYPLTKIISHNLPTSMSWKVISVALIVTILTGVLAGFFPALRAARMKPVDALRNE